MFRTWFRLCVPRNGQWIKRRRHTARLATSLGSLRLEALEDRLAPAVHTWTGGAMTGSWANNANWLAPNGSPAGDNSGQVSLVFPGNAAIFTTNNDIPTALTITSITFMGNTNYTISGNDLNLNGDVNGNGIVLDSSVTSATENITLNLTLGLAQTWTVTNANATLTAGGMLTAGAGAGLTKAGAGTLALNGMNASFQGGVTLTAGILSVGNDLALGTASASLIGGVLQSSMAVSLSNFITVGAGAPATSTIGGSNNLTLMGPVTLTSMSTLIVTNTSTTTFSGTVGGPGSLTLMVGAGTVSLPVANSNYTGTTTLDAGTLSLGNGSALGSGGSLVFNGGTVLATVDISVANPILVNAAPSAATVIGGSHNIILTGPIMLNNSGTPLLVTDSAIVTFQSSVAGIGGLTVASGTGTVELLVANNYGGITTLTSGTIIVGDPLALGTGHLVLSGGNFQSNGSVILNNPFTVAGPATVGGSNNLTFTGAGTLNSTLTVNNVVMTSTTDFMGILSGAGGLTDVGIGPLILSAANLYTGPTLINAGTLRITVDNAVPNGPNGGAVTMMSGATFDLNNHNDPIGSLAGAGNVTLGSGTLTTGSNNMPTTFSGSISGTGGLTKVGTGTFTLATNNTYQGVTTVMAGTLLVNGSQPSSNVIVSSGATLGGAGTVGTLTTSGTVSPGGPGTAFLQSANAIFNAGSTFAVKLNSTTAGSGYDQLSVSGPVNLTANPTLSITVGFSANVGDTFTILTTTGSLTGTFAGLPNNSTTVANGQTFRINYSGNTVTLTRAVAVTTTVVTSSANPSVFGQPVTFTATVTPMPPITGTPTGMVTFQDGMTVLGMGMLNNGTATFTTTTPLSVGSHSITAVYGGDSAFGTSTSPPLSQIVNQAATTVMVTGSPSPSSVGQTVTFTATVTANAPGTGTPTGMVTFRDGSAILGNGTLDSSGHATFVTSSLALGAHSITAVYNGDTNFTTSTSQSFSQNVLLATTTTLVSSLNPSTFGQSITFTVTVAPSPPGTGTPTGTVTFMDGTNTIGTASLSGGTATFTTSALTAGPHTITATYGGDSMFGSSSSSIVSQTVNQAATSTTLTSSANPVAVGQTVTFTALVAALSPGMGTPTGMVTFTDGTMTLGTGMLDSGGRATFQTSNLSLGSHNITATYGGSSNFTSSASASLTQTVQAAQSAVTITLTSSANPAVFGQTVVFTATVSATPPATGTPTGTVTFMDGTASLGTITLNASGVATLTSTMLGVGSHTITASYSGDSSFASGTSMTLTQTINQASTTTTLTSSANPSTSGQTITFTAMVSATAPGAGTPTGSVTFMEGSTVLGTGALAGGSATFQISSLSVASHSITAVYGGDGNFTQSTSAVLTQTVNQAPPTGTPNQKFVTQVYRDALGRDPDPGGLMHFSTLLDMNQATRSQVALAIQTSPEARTRQVQNLYQMFLGRPADSVGLDLSTRFLSMGGSLFELESSIVGSAEYFQRAGGSNNGFLTAVYRDALGRAIDPVGQSLGSQALTAGTSMNKLAETVFTSQEGLQDLVQSLYSQFLHRSADSVGLNAATTALQQRLQQQTMKPTEDEEHPQPAQPVGASVDDVVGILAGSDEYFGRL